MLNPWVKNGHWNLMQAKAIPVYRPTTIAHLPKLHNCICVAGPIIIPVPGGSSLTFWLFFGNLSIPDIEQAKNLEIRYAIQGTYYINKIGYTLLTRLRLEDRRIQNDAKTFEAYYRLRTQLKYTQPLNGKVIRKGIYYAVASDELFVKTQAAITGKDFFDRNRLTIGGGYALSDDTKVELLYTNEWLPRSSGNLVYHTYQINFSFTDLFRKYKDKNKAREMHSVDNGN